MAEYSSTHHVSKMLELAHPLIEVRSVPGIAPGPGYVGHDDLQRYFTQAATHQASAAAVIHRAEVTETGNVLAAGELISTTRQASAAISAWFVCRFRDGLISAVETYLPRRRDGTGAGAAAHPWHDLTNPLHRPSQ
jgi:ketosteroid isomerase-like protein